MLRWCEQADRILLSRDKRTMPIHYAAHVASGHYIPGIFLILTHASRMAVQESLELIVEASSPAEWRDRLVFLPL